MTSTPTSDARRPDAAHPRHALLDTSIGELTLVGDGSALTGVYFPGHWTDPDATTFGERVAVDDDGVFSAAARQLHEYLAGNRQQFDLPLAPSGTDRACELWSLLVGIPYGATTTYGALAAQLGNGISARAVGGYVGHNPLSIIVPCHRVVGASGQLTGYAGGLGRKRHLLQLEGAIAELPLG